MRRLLFGLTIGALFVAFLGLLRGRARLASGPESAGANPSYDEIALRAYFIGLDRDARGEPGDPLQDWRQAEQQLSAQTQCAAPASARALARW